MLPNALSFYCRHANFRLYCLLKANTLKPPTAYHDPTDILPMNQQQKKTAETSIIQLTTVLNRTKM